MPLSVCLFVCLFVCLSVRVTAGFFSLAAPRLNGASVCRVEGDLLLLLLMMVMAKLAHDHLSLQIIAKE